MDYPCRYCVPPKRHMGCHAKCPDYAKAYEDNRAEREAIQEEKRIKRIADDYSCSAVIKCKKMVHKRRG